ncbi:MAG TPA: acetolactate synthase large subunit [Acidimicrobiales bacterium]|nr:acetolactate synthase large subunit [Acidimicrobiales bacterium]
MNGAQRLIRTLVDAAVDVCFMNPGTSEMHFVAALDDVPEMRAVLGLFEGVVTGAADGYGRMAGRPAATLLHLGPGLGNGIANLHNARRARTPLVNVVGEHATSHLRHDPPLAMDIESLARPVSSWYRSSSSPDALAADTVDAVTAACGPPGSVATLVVPADVSWTEVTDPSSSPTSRGGPKDGRPAGALATVAVDVVTAVAKALRSGEPAVVLLGGSATRRAGLLAASRVAGVTGAKLMCETFPAALERGAGLPPVERLGYLAEFTQAQLAGARHLILVDAVAPVSFFAYPGIPGYLVPDGCEVHVLAAPGDDGPGGLEALADVLGAPTDGFVLQPASRPERPTGVLTAESAGAAIGALLPEGAVVSDEANTSGIFIPGATAGAPVHDWLCLTGGAIGQGMPVATGAAVACPGRRVLSLEADGSAMYTLQALWTQAREGLDVTTVIFNNGSYAILEMELGRVGAGSPGPRAHGMLDIARPDLDFAALARGMGVPATRATTAEEFTVQLERALGEDGPVLVEAVLARGGW